MNLSVLAALLFLQYPDAPQAQPQPVPQPQSVCQPGQIVVDGEGHCCWPGQAWKKRGCHGKPYCPAGLVADRRDNCVPAPAPAPQPQYQPQPGTYNPYPDAPQAPGTFAGVPTMPAPNLVPVRFTAAKPEDSYEVEVLTGGMPACKTPCELRLVPARYKLRVRGSARFNDELRVLNQPMDLQVRHASGGYKALGTASVIVGAVAFAGGLTASGLVFLSAEANRDPAARSFPADPYWARKRNEKLLICSGVSVAGAVLAIAGGVVGFRKAGHTGFTEVRASQAPAPAPETAPAPEGAPAPEVAPPPSSQRDEPAIQLLGLGAAPTENGVQLGAMFAF